MSDDPYVYPGSTVLKNKFGIRDQSELDAIERQHVAFRTVRDVPNPRTFDLAHLQAIHRHLFQDIYEWAGELRTLEIAKGGHQFQFKNYITTGMADVHRRLHERRFLRDLSPEEFSKHAAEIVGDINYVHPFREGNGRTQLLYLQQLTEHAGHGIDLRRLAPDSWLQASKDAFASNYETMARCIVQALTPRRTQNQERSGRKPKKGPQH